MNRRWICISIAITILLLKNVGLHAQNRPVNANANAMFYMSTEELLKVAHDDPARRSIAYGALGGRQDAVIPLLEIIARETDSDIRDGAIYPLALTLTWTCQSIPPDAKDTVNAVIPVLLKAAGEPRHAGSTEYLLSRLALPQQLMPTLRQWLSEPNATNAGYTNPPDHFSSAMLIISDIQPATPELIDLVTQRVRETGTPMPVLDYLGMNMPASESGLLQIIDKDQQVFNRLKAIQYLTRRGGRAYPLSDAAKIVVEKCMNSSDEGLRETAAQALLISGRDSAPDAVKALAVKLSDARFRRGAINELKRLDFSIVVPLLIPLMHDSDQDVRAAVAEILCTQRYDPREITPPVEVLTLLDDPSIYTRRCATNFVDQCEKLKCVVGPVSEFKAFRINNGETDNIVDQASTNVPVVNQTASVSPTTPASSKLFLSPVFYAISFLIWPMAILVVIGTIAGRLMQEQR